MLQVVGIILIIWGIVRGIFSFAMFTMDVYEITPDGIIQIQGFHVVEEVYLLALVPWATIITQFLMFLLGAVVDSIAGITGVVNWKRPERANRCLLWGIAAVAVNVLVMAVLGLAAGIVGLGVHILYMIGAYRLREA